MYDFIIQLSIVISLSVIIYLLAGVIARIKEDDLITVEESNFFDRWLDHGYISRIDNWFSAAFGKFLRRLRVIVLKLDNLISRHIIVSSKNHKSKSMNDLNGEDK
jgi:hypothetical protein